MTFIQPIIVTFSLLAFAAAVQAADDTKAKSETKAQSSGTMKSDTKASAGASKPQSFASLDTNKDGSISRAEIAAHAELAAKFKGADKDSDGKLSRSEYDAMATADGQPAAAGGTMKKEEKKPAK
jgi:Ca2+-binding EF-hand superfamily protein